MDDPNLGVDFMPDTVVEIPIPTPGVTVPQVLKYILIIILCLFLEYVLQLVPRLADFVGNRVSEVKATAVEAWRKPRTVRKAIRSVLRLFRKWEIFTIPGVTFVLVYFCALSSLSYLPAYYATPDNIELWTLQEQHVDLTSTGVSATAPVRDPRGNSPFPPRSAEATNYFCGRPTASSYDGYTGAAHAAYIHHDMERDRFVVRTFGRGGTRVDHRRRMGIGRSTYEVFCGATAESQVHTPLAPSVLVGGNDNWQVPREASAARPSNGDFNFTLEKLAEPISSRNAASPVKDNFIKEDQTLRTHYRLYSRADNLANHRHLDFIYSYVNGSDITRGYTKPFAKQHLCWNLIAAVQMLWGELQRLRGSDTDAGGPRVSEDTFARYVSELLFTKLSSPCSMVKLLSNAGEGKAAMTQVEASLWWAVTRASPTPADAATPEAIDKVPVPYALTNIELLRAIGAERDKVWMDAIDTDCDELRHSMRGLLDHTRGWSRGRVTVVSPYSNVPLWLNQSKNFFLRSLYADLLMSDEKKADDSHTPLSTAQFRFAREVHTHQLQYTRLHVVDQRALMPPAPLTTVNSYVIEPFVYRLRNVSSVFVYMNDDYLIMKDVDLEDFVNEFGGPVLRIRRKDSMEYYESKNDYFRRGFVFNTMRMQRDVDKLPADVEELVQPSALADALALQDGGEAAQLRRGIVRGDWAAFTAAVHTRDAGTAAAAASVPPPPCNDSVCAWAAACGGAADTCDVPRVSIAGEPSWEVDAAGSFHVVDAAGAPPVLAGHAEMPRIGGWGGRVLDRAAADIIAPRYYLETDTVVLRDTPTNPAPAATMMRTLEMQVSAVEEGVRQIAEDPDDDGGARDRLLHVFTNWMDIMLEHEFPTHRAFKTQPRLRKYRVRLDSHAPYPQCRNMWSYIHKRYTPDLNLNMFLMRKRSTLDFLPPSTHTVHMLRHPWAGSSQYIPYLMAKEAWRMQAATGKLSEETAALFPVVDVVLDNEDGCAPATYITEALESARYHEFRNDVNWNTRAMKTIRSYRGRKPFTNINSKFTVDSVGVTLRDFLEELFPSPMLLEEGWKAALPKKQSTTELSLLTSLESNNGKALTLFHIEESFRKFTRLPLIVVSNDEEGFCPLLRSLRHAMPSFRGLRIVQVLVPPVDGRSLYAARADQRHGYRNFLPVTRCTLLPGRLARVTLPADSSEADIIVAGLRAARDGVKTKYWAAPALVELRGLRVARRAVQAVVIDARTLHSGANGFTDLPHALATPAELLAHEDFSEVLLTGETYEAAQAFVRMPTDAEAAAPASIVVKGEKPRRVRREDYTSSVLLLSEAEAEERNVHWAYGASEHDLLSSMPLPYLQMEDRDANVNWGY